VTHAANLSNFSIDSSLLYLLFKRIKHIKGTGGTATGGGSHQNVDPLFVLKPLPIGNGITLYL